MPSGPDVTHLLWDWGGCALWRCLWPVTALWQRGYPVRWVRGSDKAAVQRYTYQGEAVVLHRTWIEPSTALQVAASYAERHKRGVAVLYEIDDDMFSPACLEQVALADAAPRSRAAYEAERQARILTLQMVDGITVPTEPLAAVVRQYTAKPVEVVPNAIDWDGFQRVCQAAPRPTDALTIGWVGGTRVDADFTAMAAAWTRIAARFPSVEFVVVGHRVPALCDAVPHERLHLGGWQPIERYPAMYAGIDIGCAPLSDHPFNVCKSPQKTFEYAAAGAAVVASPLVYGDVLRNGKDGLIAETADEWEWALARLIESPWLRSQVAGRWARRVQQRHSITAVAPQWPRAWARLIAAWRTREGRCQLQSPNGVAIADASSSGELGMAASGVPGALDGTLRNGGRLS